MAAVMKSLAAATLSRTVFLWARLAAMAEAKIQPVPCVFLVSIRSARNSVNAAVVKHVCGYSSRWPPFMTTLSGPKSRIARAASFICTRVLISRPVSAPASCRLGVTTVASGSNLSFKAAMASRFSSGAPLLAIITGSTTSGSSFRSEIAAATASMIALLAEHSCLYRIAANIAHASFDLHDHKLWVDLQHPVDAGRILCRESGDRGHAKGAKRGDRFQIGLNPGSAARNRILR